MINFSNRVDAGKQLASVLEDVDKNAIVLAIPRGGVVVGFEISKRFKIPIDIIVTKKIGAPGNPELAIGAVAEDGSAILDDNLVERLNVSKQYIESEIERKRDEINRRLSAYRGDVPYPSLKNRQIIVVDDGVATGSTLKAALRSVKNRGAKKVIAAIPVGPPSTIQELKENADQVICLSTPEPFYAIGQFYDDFAQTTDEEVKNLLRFSRKGKPKEDVEINE